jgi:hypothetical protein
MAVIEFTPHRMLELAKREDTALLEMLTDPDAADILEDSPLSEEEKIFILRTSSQMQFEALDRIFAAANQKDLAAAAPYLRFIGIDSEYVERAAPLRS